MAKLTGDLLFTGTLGGLTAYRLPGNPHVIIRTKGGVSPARIKHDRVFRVTRLYNQEFGGAAKAGSALRQVLFPISRKADHNLTPRFNQLCKSIQSLDNETPVGQRGIYFSRNRALLQGLTLSLEPFKNLCGAQLLPEICRMNGVMQMEVPELVPGQNLQIPWRPPFYQLVLTMGILYDFYQINGKYTSHSGQVVSTSQAYRSAWQAVEDSLPAQMIHMQIKDPADCQIPGTTIVVAAALYGGAHNKQKTTIEPVKRIVAAEIIAAV
jgi:hypothetical protein